MSKAIQNDDNLKERQENFSKELKIYINQKLFEKKLISEDMYCTAKELLIKGAS